MYLYILLKIFRNMIISIQIKTTVIWEQEKGFKNYAVKHLIGYYYYLFFCCLYYNKIQINIFNNKI